MTETIEMIKAMDWETIALYYLLGALVYSFIIGIIEGRLTWHLLVGVVIWPIALAFTVGQIIRAFFASI